MLNTKDIWKRFDFLLFAAVFVSMHFWNRFDQLSHSLATQP